MQSQEKNAHHESHETTVPDTRKPYHAPALTDCGTVSEMTKGGGAGGEPFGAS